MTSKRRLEALEGRYQAHRGHRYRIGLKKQESDGTAAYAYALDGEPVTQERYEQARQRGEIATEIVLNYVAPE